MDGKSGYKTNEEHLKDLSRKLVPIAPNGDCLFESIARQIQGVSLLGADDLRESAVIYGIEHSDNFSEFYWQDDSTVDLSSPGKRKQAFEKNLEQYLCPGVWNSEIGDFMSSLVALAANLKIVILKDNALPIFVPHEFEVTDESIVIVHSSNGTHYDATRPMTDEEKSAQQRPSSVCSRTPTKRSSESTSLTTAQICSKLFKTKADSSIISKEVSWSSHYPSPEDSPTSFSPDLPPPNSPSSELLLPDSSLPNPLLPDPFSPDSPSPDSFPPYSPSPELFSPDSFPPYSPSPELFSPDPLSPESHSLADCAENKLTTKSLHSVLQTSSENLECLKPKTDSLLFDVNPKSSETVHSSTNLESSEQDGGKNLSDSTSPATIHNSDIFVREKELPVAIHTLDMFVRKKESPATIDDLDVFIKDEESLSTIHDPDMFVRKKESPTTTHDLDMFIKDEESPTPISSDVFWSSISPAGEKLTENLSNKPESISTIDLFDSSLKLSDSSTNQLLMNSPMFTAFSPGNQSSKGSSYSSSSTKSPDPITASDCVELSEHCPSTKETRAESPSSLAYSQKSVLLYPVESTELPDVLWEPSPSRSDSSSPTHENK